MRQTRPRAEATSDRTNAKISDHRPSLRSPAVAWFCAASLAGNLAAIDRWTDCEEHLSPTNLTSAARIGDPRRSCFRPVPGPEVGSPRDGDYPSYRFGYPPDLGDARAVR